jgi:outer membrane receptor for ferrienterochelin and colicins
MCFFKKYLLVLLFFSMSAGADETLKIQSVDVAGMRDETDMRKDSITQKVVFGRKEIEDLSVMTAGEVLSKLPGVEVGAGGTRARGMSRDSIRVLIDGERQYGGTMGAFSRMPASDIERIEIHRGSSAEFGGSSPLTINIILKKDVSKSVTEVKAGLGFRDGQSNEQLAWSESGSNGAFSWVLPVSLNFSRSPANSSLDRQSVGATSFWQQENANGVNEMEHHAFSPRLSWKSGRDSVTLSSMVFLGPSDKITNTSLFSAINPSSPLSPNGIRDANEDGFARYLRVRLDGEKYFGESKLSGRLSLNNRLNTTDVTRNSFDLNGNASYVNQNTRSTQDEVNGSVRWDQPIDLHFVSAALEYNKLTENDQQVFIGSLGQGNYQSSSQDQVLWVQDAWTLRDTLTLTSGLRFENMQLSSSGNAQQDNALLPSLAIRWQPQDAWVFRSSLGAGMKIPKISEISNALTPSVTSNTPLDPNVRGNPNLKPEHSINFELVGERYLANKGGVIGANLYVRATSDFTEHRITNENTTNTPVWVDRPYNVGDALHWGLELDGKVNAEPLGFNGGTAKAHLTLPHARVDDALLGITRNAADTPKYVLSLGWDQMIPKWQSNCGLSLQLSGRSETNIASQVSTVPGQQAYTEARALLDVFWLYKINPRFNFRVSAQNLLDEDMRRVNRYLSNDDDWKSLANDFGYRTVMFSIEGRW